MPRLGIFCFVYGHAPVGNEHLAPFHWELSVAARTAFFFIACRSRNVVPACLPSRETQQALLFEASFGRLCALKQNSDLVQAVRAILF